MSKSAAEWAAWAKQNRVAFEVGPLIELRGEERARDGGLGAVRRERGRPEHGTLTGQGEQFLKTFDVPELDGLAAVAADGKPLAVR